jgi:hypothetical protein
MPQLTNPRHELFAQEVARGKTADAAYVLAGYKQNIANASRLKANEKVLARISELQAHAADLVGISKAWVLQRLKENVERSMQIETVTDREGKPIGEYVYQGSVANRALELLGKDMGMFIDRSEVTGKDGEPLVPGVLQVPVPADPVAWSEAAQEYQRRLRANAHTNGHADGSGNGHGRA